MQIEMRGAAPGLRRLVLGFVAASIMAMPATTIGQTVARQPAPGNALWASSDAIEALVSRVMPSVVQVVVTGYRPQGDGQRIRRERTLGSGVVVDSDGFILTNAHVVQGAERVQVVLASHAATSDSARVLGQETRPLDARIVGQSEELDLALLQVDLKGLTPLPLADYSQLRQGELVFAFGSPDALRNSVSMGVVSAVAQQTESRSPVVWIQTDAAVNPGNSGGPLVNSRGEVVGLNTFIRSLSGGSEGLGFALPSAVIALAYPQLRDYGHLHRAILGVAAEPVTPQLRKGLGLGAHAGVIAADVIPGGPAARAGIRVGDVITAINGQTLESMSLVRFNLFQLTLADGQALSVDLVRGSEPVNVTVTAAVPPHQCERAEPVDTRANLVERLGFIGMSVGESTAEILPGLRVPFGVMVVVRVETSHTPEVSLARGDVIHAVNGAPVTTPAELRDTLARVQQGDVLVLQVERQGALTYLVYGTD
jgi:serine protease Do